MNTKELCRIIKLSIPFKEIEEINKVGKGIYHKKEILEFLEQDIKVGLETLENLENKKQEIKGIDIEQIITSVKNLIESEKQAIKEVNKLGNISYQFTMEYMKEV